MKKFYILAKYIRYLFTSKSRHGVHSPFVYDLIDKVIYDKTISPLFFEIDKTRKALKSNNTKLIIEDFGAGSSINNSKSRKIADIARYSAKSKKYAQLLFRLVKYFKPHNILELGTSLGITSIYLAKAENNSILYTLEGCTQTSKIALENFEKAGIKNIKLIQGKFEDTLPALIPELPVLDFVFFDGNHQKEATLSYFNTCLQKVDNDSVFIFDDIHWSEGMEQAWKTITSHPKVTVTVDLFFVGLVFFRKEQPRENFTVRF
ncbi:MAG: class I SAM-dependent methyltransferase [Bacteroidetes bacterium]|nr:class I SAM-dependent methyltransferase [Bacteroidota bacterium]HET6245999.1 class I SAM-dependent methyltransferase [Bacteroidia bacterium]